MPDPSLGSKLVFGTPFPARRRRMPLVGIGKAPYSTTSRLPVTSTSEQIRGRYSARWHRLGPCWECVLANLSNFAQESKNCYSLTCHEVHYLPKSQADLFFLILSPILSVFGFGIARVRPRFCVAAFTILGRRRPAILVLVRTTSRRWFVACDLAGKRLAIPPLPQDPRDCFWTSRLSRGEDVWIVVDENEAVEAGTVVSQEAKVAARGAEFSSPSRFCSFHVSTSGTNTPDRGPSMGVCEGNFRISFIVIVQQSFGARWNWNICSVTAGPPCFVRQIKNSCWMRWPLWWVSSLTADVHYR